MTSSASHPSPSPSRSSRVGTGNLDGLLEEQHWIQRLARSLVGEVRAEDLIQDTWVVALEKAPTTGPLEGWFTTVQRNLARRRGRSDASRREREREAARGEALPSSAELAERVETQRSVAKAVLELEDPYRTTLLLRYWDDLPPRAIAKRQGIPVSTVKTRLTRGQEQLRVRLDAEAGGDGRTWALTLMPLADAARRAAPFGSAAVPGTAAVAIGALVMHAKWILALLTLATAGLLWNLRRSPERSAPQLSPPTVAREALATDAVQPTETLDETARIALEGGQERPSTSAELEPDVSPAVATTWTVSVVDARGREVRDVPVHATTSEPLGSRTTSPDESETQALLLGRTDEAGRVVLPERTNGLLQVLDPNWTTVLAASPRDGSVLVIAPRIEVAGRVIDEDGLPIEGARVQLDLPLDLRSALDLQLDHSTTRAWSATTDLQGRYAFASFPALENATLQAEALDRSPKEIPAPTSSQLELNFLLEQNANTTFLTGIVVDPNGEPATEAVVLLGRQRTLTDERGLFGLELREHALLDSESDPTVLAIAEGFRPALFEPNRRPDGGLLWPDFLELRLPGPALAIQGRVLDERTGEGLEGIQVWLANPTLVGGGGDSDLGETLLPQLVEGLARGSGSPRPYVLSDARGSFLIEGLQERTYDLELLQGGSLVRTIVPDVLAGTEELRIELPTTRVWPIVRGIVQTPDGSPAPDVDVRVGSTIVSMNHSSGSLSATLHGNDARTDADGRFTLRDVPMDHVHLSLSGANIVANQHEFAELVEFAGNPLDDPGDLQPLARVDAIELVAYRRCAVRVTLAEPGRADAFALLDPNGKRLPLTEHQGAMTQTSDRQPLVDGRSTTVYASEAAATIVLFGEDGTEVERLPLRLLSAETNELLL